MERDRDTDRQTDRRRETEWEGETERGGGGGVRRVRDGGWGGGESVCWREMTMWGLMS